MAAWSIQSNDWHCRVGVTAKAAGMSWVRGVSILARALGGELMRGHKKTVTHSHGTDSYRAWRRGQYKVMTGPVVQACDRSGWDVKGERGQCSGSSAQRSAHARTQADTRSRYWLKSSMAAWSIQSNDWHCSVGVTAKAAGMSWVRGVSILARALGGELMRGHKKTVTHSHGTDSYRAWRRGQYKVMTGPVVQAWRQKRLGCQG